MSRPKPKVWPPLGEWSPFIGWKLPAKHRKAIARHLRGHARDDLDDAVLDRIERICGAALLRRYFHSKLPLPSGTHEALAPVADLARQMRERLDALAPPVRSEFERRFKAELRTYQSSHIKIVDSDGKEVELRAPRPTLETYLRMVEATLYRPVRGSRPQDWKKVAVRSLAEAWTEVTGEPPEVKQVQTAEHPEQGPFADFVRACFAAMDIKKAPTILHYLPKK